MEIWKFKLELTGTQTIAVREGATILSVDFQRDDLCLWVLLDTNKPVEHKIIDLFGTGHLVPPTKKRFIGTVQQHTFVWHIFERLQ